MKASVFIATSLDGFIARANGDIDWLPSGGEEEHGYDAFIATVDALVIGRKTYETVLAFDTWPYGEKPVFVLSTGAPAPAPPGAVVEHTSGSPAGIVSQLAARGVQHIYVDGGITIQRFLQAGLIQHLIITSIPVLIGTGIPLFGTLPADIVLRHVGTREYASGLVQSEYLLAACHAQAAMLIVRQVDALNRFRFRSDAESLAAWKSARDVAWPAPEKGEPASGDAQQPAA